MTSLLRITVVAVALLAALNTVAFAESKLGETFGEQVARTLQSGDGAGFNALMDKDVLIERALEGMEANDAFVRGLRSGLERGLAQVGTILVNTMGEDVRLVWLRNRKLQGDSRALVRIDLGERGINYIDFFVHEREDGSLAIYDWFDYVQGQTYSNSLRMAMSLMVNDDPSLMSRLMGFPDVDRESAELLVEMGRAGQQGNWAAWLDVYRTLPEGMRHSRVLLATRVAAAGAIGDQTEYMNAMSDLHTHQGDDPTLSLALVDYYLLLGDFKRAYGAVDRLDEYTGGDAALTNLRSGIALYEGNDKASVRFARRAIRQDAGYEQSYWNLMVAASRTGNFKAAMEGVRGLEQRFGYALSEEDLRESEDLQGLAESDEWEAHRRLAPGSE